MCSAVSRRMFVKGTTSSRGPATGAYEACGAGTWLGCGDRPGATWAAGAVGRRGGPTPAAGAAAPRDAPQWRG